MHSFFSHLAQVFDPIPRLDVQGSPVVLYSQVRIIRNLYEYPFPVCASPEVLRDVNDAIIAVASRELPNFSTLSLEDLETEDKRFCVERRWAAKRWERQDVGGIAIAPAEGITLTINEEDHIGIRAILGGLNLNHAYSCANAVDDVLSQRLVYAFDQQLGYLAAKPIRTGLGLMASVCVHLPALVWGEKMTPITLAARAVGCNIVGFNGRDSAMDEDLFFISNRPSFEDDEGTMLKRLNGFLETVIENETAARKLLLERTEARLRDRFHRVLAILQNAQLIEIKESQVLLMQMRLATDLQWLPEEFRPQIDGLLIRLCPAHLRAEHGIVEGQEDSARAEILHKVFASAKLAD
jgi:protein arginine kinase